MTEKLKLKGGGRRKRGETGWALFLHLVFALFAYYERCIGTVQSLVCFRYH